MSNFAPATILLPYQLLAAQPFAIGWALASENGTQNGAAYSLSGVTDIRVSALLRVARGVTQPAATVWTQSGAGGVTQSSVTIGGVVYPYLTVAGAAAPAAGVYDVTVALVLASGEVWVLACVFAVQPAP
jgi:hypothetical protein